MCRVSQLINNVPFGAITLTNNVESFDADGRSIGVIFETAAPFDTPRLMADLVSGTVAAIREKELHPLLVIRAFVVHFLAIHPSQDGNGRLSRVLTTLLLLQSGYRHVPYSSLERIVEEGMVTTERCGHHRS